MENLEPYLSKFSESGRRVLESSLKETRRRGQHFISPEYILFAVMTEETDLFNAATHNLSINPQDIRLAIEKRLENSYRHTGTGIRVASDTTDIFRCSMEKTRSEGRRIIDAGDMCFVLATDKYNLLENILQNPKG